MLGRTEKPSLCKPEWLQDLFGNLNPSRYPTRLEILVRVVPEQSATDKLSINENPETEAFRTFEAGTVRSNEHVHTEMRALPRLNPAFRFPSRGDDFVLFQDSLSLDRHYIDL